MRAIKSLKMVSEVALELTKSSHFQPQHQKVCQKRLFESAKI